MRLDPRVAATRTAVAAILAPGEVALVACSGGPDSVALAAAAAFHVQRRGARIGAVVVDHGLQVGSADVAGDAARICERLGLSPVRTVLVSVDGSRNLEAHARDARYAALREAARAHGATRVLLGHTLDDQAETALLALARGSGARALSGMAPQRDEFVRPFLTLRRQDVAAAGRIMLDEAGIHDSPWQDPHNASPAFARVRVRQTVLPVLERELGPGISEALARTADQLREDADLLDRLAGELVDRAMGAEGGHAVDVLAAAHPALRRRAIHRILLAAGAPAGRISTAHVHAVDALLTDWHGQGPISLPGGCRATRACGRLWVDAAQPT